MGCEVAKQPMKLETVDLGPLGAIETMLDFGFTA
jgi:hypothetical protein